MYESFRVAQTEQKRGEENLRQGFRKVAGYLFGGNEEQRSMSMTAPVIQENHNEGIRVAFVMSTKEVDVPIPHDEDVVLSRVEWGRVAVIRFSGYGNQKRFQKKEEVLRAWMQKKGIEGEDMGIYAQYNSPYAFPLLRRNEVLIRLK
jgi:DNA gyrase inhibitor GyrI